ncbi:hypothetical protein [Micromonospora sp. HK10]|uniref:hypothetical protein n=1 Tax=Micromonospora sp. HK10 TaxID=1538294 RepID=UPI00062733B4|nr:hypothetical protein [Micromonospora sp. HK10]KKK00534.1 hypothetical protein LQ51_21360 [Micromonospora sp. HK10]
MVAWVVASTLALKLFLLCHYLLDFDGAGRSLLVALLFTFGAVLLPRQALNLAEDGRQKQTSRAVALVLMGCWVALLIISLTIAAHVSTPTGSVFGIDDAAGQAPYGILSELTVVTAMVVMAALVASGICRPRVVTLSDVLPAPREAWTAKLAWALLMALSTGVLFSTLMLFMPSSYPMASAVSLSVIATGVALAAVHTASATGSLVAEAGLTRAGWGRVASVASVWAFFGISFFWVLPAASPPDRVRGILLGEVSDTSVAPAAAMAGAYLVAGCLAFGRAYARRSLVLAEPEAAPRP